MTEEEWLKRQEGLERRRMRSLRDKREAEETIKAKLRKAVTARFRGKLGTGGGGEGSGTEREAAGGTKGAVSQVRLCTARMGSELDYVCAIQGQAGHSRGT
jgi:hypothetical protein